MSETMTPTISMDEVLNRLFNTTEGRDDPYPLYRELHEEAPPLFRSGLDGLWYTCRYEICHQMLLDQRLGSADELRVRRPGGMGEEQQRQMDELVAERRRDRSLLSLNPPDHTRLRRLVSKGFTFRRVEALRPRIAELVDVYLDRFGAGRAVDVMAELAFPLPVAVIGELVGVPAEDRERFRSLVRDGLLANRPDVSREELEAAGERLQEMEDYFADLIGQRRAHPGDDLISALIAVRDDEEGGGRLSEDELRGLIFLLFLAGFVTTTNLIGNGLLALMRHPDQMERLWGDAALVPSAVEEMLRFDSPVQFLRRDVLTPVEVEGVSLPPGEALILLVGAANRDPRRFPDPDRLDIGREENHHLAFGSGIHHCLGAPLARAEGQVVFGRLRERFSGFELLEPEPPFAAGFLRGRASLVVAPHVR